MTERFIVIDLETTDREPEKAQIVEWAAVVIEPAWFGQEQRAEFGGLVRPPIPIPPETSAVHHITDADVVDAPHWLIEGAKLFEILSPGHTAIAVAHNAEYERTLLARELPPVPGLRWLCTYKAALRVFPESLSHSNEALRYYLGLGTGRRQHQAPHSALHDARVTAQLLEQLIQRGTSVHDMIAWTDQPALLPRCPIGDYRGMKWAEIPEDFLHWILYRARNMRQDIRFCAQKELERRDAEQQQDEETEAEQDG